MLITMTIIASTSDSSEAVDHTVAAFAAALADAGVPETPFEKFGELAFQFSVSHPALGEPGGTRASYWREGDIFFAGAELDYEAWAGASWARRVGAVAQASKQALGAVFKTRLLAEERATVARLIDGVAETLARSPPAPLPSLQPVYVSESESGNWRSTSFSPPPASEPLDKAGRTRALEPPEVRAYFEKLRTAGQPLQMVKLHKRQGRLLLYREAWVDGQSVVEHVGVCGERGATSRYSAEEPTRQQEIILAIVEGAKADGFTAIPEEELSTLLVSKEISGSGTKEDLKRRHALEDFLNTLTGWLGLGHCDGGSTGSGSMEALCLVIDYEIAAKAIAKELASSAFSDFIVSPQIWANPADR